MPKGDRPTKHWIAKLVDSYTLDPLTECWVWHKSRYRKGYGCLLTGSRKDGTRRYMIASRWIWRCVNGSIPANLCVLHTCDNPPCINPMHLFLGTNNDNMQDMIRKGRSADRRGVRNGRAKLTPTQVAEIRRTPSSVTTADLARYYGLSHTGMTRVRRGMHWSEVDA